MPSGTIEASLLDIDPCLGCPVPRERTARGRTGGKEQGVPGDSSPCYPRRTNPAPVEEPDIGRGKRQGPSRLVTKTSRQHPPDPTKQPDQDNRIPLCHGGPRRSLAAPTRLHPDPPPPNPQAPPPPDPSGPGHGHGHAPSRRMPCAPDASSLAPTSPRVCSSRGIAIVKPRTGSHMELTPVDARPSKIGV